MIENLNHRTNLCISCFISDPTDGEDNDREPDPDFIINHLNQNHYSPERTCDEDQGHPSGPLDHQENHTAMDIQDHGEGEEENGQHGDGELQLDSEGGAESLSLVDRPPRYPSPAALKKQMNSESLEVNNELRALITKEIRKPGRRTYRDQALCGMSFLVSTRRPRLA